jgi:hypothetical protein
MTRAVRSNSWFLAYSGFLLIAGGCSGDAVQLVAPSGSQQQNVMVIDEGIDLTVNDLRGRVSAAYTETCTYSNSGGYYGTTGDGGFASLKAMYLAALAQPDDSCHLTEGISAKQNPLATIAQFEGRWNAMVKANKTPSQVFTQAEIAQLMGPIDNEFSMFNYHGTATSSTVAHENPNVRLVLVERQLGSEGSLTQNFPCINQSDIDTSVQLLSDPEVYAAAVNQPASIDGELADAESKGDVGIINESFGAASRQTLEMLQNQYCSTPVDLSAYFQLIDNLTNDHNKTITGPAVLTVQAAGNDGVQINTGADSLSCDLGDPKDLLVGAYNAGTLTQNTFSNYGACVNLYAPGQAVVVEYAGGWLIWADGTSFASPLTVRYASMATSVPSPFDPTTARTAVLAAIDPSNQFLPLSNFPTDFFYTPAGTTTDFVVPRFTPTAASPQHRQLSTYELHRVLGPIERLKRLRGL